jgi:16S rRNA (uracil1498-N3)-methyltransferase
MRRYLTQSALGNSGSTAQLSPEDSHHLLRVNLTPRGSTVLLFDESGQEAEAILVGVEAECAIFELKENAHPSAEIPPLVLIQGQAKRPALAQLLRMATELGATEIRIFHGAHSIAKGENLDRWARVVAGTIAQCGRHSAPDLHHFETLDDALQSLPSGPRLVCLPGETTPQNRPVASVLLIGPEGGLHPDEVQIAKENGFSPLGLGQFVLRCDTAVAAAMGLSLRTPAQGAGREST